MSIILPLVSLALGISLGWWLGRFKSKKAHLNHNSELSRQKDDSKDKSRSLTMMMEIIIASAKESQEQLTSMMAGIFDKSSNLAQNSAASLAGISKQVEVSQTHVHELLERMQNLEEQSTAGIAVTEKLSNVLVEFKETSSRLTQIQDQMASILDKTKTINSIGQDAEMLALNAAIEAARAGEMGRGFAVVADSMKALAKSSQEMTTDIQLVLATSNTDINEITSSIHERSETLLEQTHFLVRTYNDVSDSIKAVGKNVNVLDEEFVNTLEVVNQETQLTRTSMEDMIREFTVKANEAAGLEIIDMSPSDANKTINKFDFLIDVRRPEEYNDELGHISGTKLITLQTELPDALKTLPKDKKYLFICRSGGRSTKAAQQALLQGITDVYNLEGGMLAWRKTGL
jgi:methyl-accepting chemotaxis protein